MEEADALASRAGIMAGRMLALGTTAYLRRKHGNAYYVHLVHSQAPHTSDEKMQRIRMWITESFPGANIEEKTYHGQMRFSVPARAQQPQQQQQQPTMQSGKDMVSITANEDGGISVLFTLLEQHKADLGFEYYSVSQTTLDQVFLSIVGKHDVEEEGERDRRSAGTKRRRGKVFSRS